MEGQSVESRYFPLIEQQSGLSCQPASSAQVMDPTNDILEAAEKNDEEPI